MGYDGMYDGMGYDGMGWPPLCHVMGGHPITYDVLAASGAMGGHIPSIESMGMMVTIHPINLCGQVTD